MDKLEQQKIREHFDKLAKKMVEDAEIKYVPRVPATLYKDGQEFAKGLAQISDSVIFFPDIREPLEIVLYKSISLKAKGNDTVIPLTHSRCLLDLSTHLMWFFDIEKNEPVA